MKTFNDNLNIHTITEPYFHANWSAPSKVKTLISTRHGGISQAPYHSLNVGAHVGDCPEHVAHNRAIIQQAVSVPIAYLNQTHSTIVVPAENALRQNLEADASVNSDGKVACAVMTADCLPVLFCSQQGTVVAAAHAGWRGLANGILQNTITQMNCPTNEILAYLGPAIGAEAFEVGQDVYQAFCENNADAHQAFIQIEHQKYLANIYLLATQILNQQGVTQIFGGDFCTVLSRDTFFSYRRDGQTGRMVSVIWLDQ